MKVNIFLTFETRSLFSSGTPKFLIPLPGTPRGPLGPLWEAQPQGVRLWVLYYTSLFSVSASESVENLAAVSSSTRVGSKRGMYCDSSPSSCRLKC